MIRFDDGLHAQSVVVLRPPVERIGVFADHMPATKPKRARLALVKEGE